MYVQDHWRKNATQWKYIHKAKSRYWEMRDCRILQFNSVSLGTKHLIGSNT